MLFLHQRKAMRKQIAAGNWKMNLDFEEGLQIARDIANQQTPEDVLVILGAPFPYLKSLVDMTMATERLELAAQNCSKNTSGAFTGETSAAMLSSINVPYVILGHSERRSYHQESDELILSKIKEAFSKNLKVIYCCGEPLEIREAGTHVSYVRNQLSESILNLEASDFKNIIVAYEPIWAIGTGKTASPEQAQEMHAEIRNILAEKMGNDIAQNTSILYGGSVKPANAKDLFSQTDVDGGLVGGASLKSADFIEIIHSF